MRGWVFVLTLCASTAVVSAQVGEFSVSGGVSRFNSANLGDSAGAAVDLHDGFHLGLRFTLNTYKFFGHEFGYAYNHSNIQIHTSPVSDNSTSVHQGFYDFLVYATPEGTRIRPFLAAGGNFSSFYPPGTGIYGGGQTKFGVNVGGGVKVKVSPLFGIRFDVRDYNTGKPLGSIFENVNGRLNQLEISAGVSLLF
jgi:hypothetical protein